jgi:hypothetical protein
VRSYVREQFVDKGMVADISFHEPGKEGDERNYHAHVLLTMRPVQGDGFGLKDREWNRKDNVELWREHWADHQNRAFEKLGIDVRVDHRSLEAQGIDREPEPKLGPTASAMERRGVGSERGDERREVQARNAERDELQRQYAELCGKLGLVPEQARELSQVASRADPVHKTARQKMAERLRQQAAEKEQDRQQWREARAEAVNERKKARETGKGSAGSPVKPEPKKPRPPQTKAERRTAMIKRLRRQAEEKRLDFGREL